MKLKEQSTATIEETIKKALHTYATTGDQTVVTDIYLQVIPETGTLTIYDDDDEILGECIIEEWKHSDDSLYNKVESLLRSILEKIKREGLTNMLSIIPPYSFVLVDCERETVVDLTIVDDDLSTIVLNGEFLSGLDDELNSFIEDLLEE